MNDQTKLLLGLAGIGVVAYLVCKSMKQPKATFVSKKVTKKDCVTPVEILTYNPNSNPVECHYACENRDGDIINLGPAPCPQ